MNIMCDGAGTRLFYRQAGTGTPAVLLHGFAASGAQWTQTVSHLRTRHQIIAPDLPGYGGSQIAAYGNGPGLAPQVRALTALLDHIGQPVHLAGHGFGAAVAAKLAMTHGDRIASLALIEPCLFHLPPGTAPRDRAQHREILHIEARLRTADRNGNPHAGMRAFIDHWHGAGTWDGLGAALRDMHASESAQVLRDLAACRAETWPLDQVSRIACPVLACMGAASHPATRRAAELVADAAPVACLKIVPDAGHMLPLTHAGTVAGALGQLFALAERGVGRGPAASRSLAA